MKRLFKHGLRSIRIRIAFYEICYLKTIKTFFNFLTVTYLERDDEVQEQHHVDDAVDNRVLHGHDEEHSSTDHDPVLAAHVPDPMTL